MFPLLTTILIFAFNHNYRQVPPQTPVVEKTVVNPLITNSSSPLIAAPTNPPTNQNKTSAFNTSSGKILENVAKVAIEKSEVLVPVPSTTPTPKPEPLSTIIPTPTIYPTIEPIPLPTFYPCPPPIHDPHPPYRPDVYICLDTPSI